MPAAIPLVAALAGGIAASSGIGAALFVTPWLIAATNVLIGAVVTFAVGYAGSALFGSGSSSSSSTTDRTQQVRQAITNHRIVYGEVYLSGPVVFLWSNQSGRTNFSSLVNGNQPANYAKQDLLYMVHVLAAHEVEAISQITLNDTLLTDSSYTGAAACNTHLGAADQGADAMLVAETDGTWTDAHRLRGRAYIATVLKWDSSIWSGVPNVAAIVRGKRLYDPRTGETAYSSNCALVIADYLTADYGLKCSWDEIDLPLLIAAANICDEAVPLKDGGTEPRYSCDGTFDLDQAPDSILEQLVATMAGSVVQTGGLWQIFAGASTAAVDLSIGEDDLRGNVTVSANRSMRDLFNCVRATYVRPAASWQTTDAPVLYGQDAITQDNGTKYYQDLSFPFVTSGYQAQRLMKIALKRNRAQRSINVPMNLKGLFYRCEDVVAFATGRMAGKNYRVTNFQLTADPGIDLTIEEEPADVFAWDPAVDEQDLGDVGVSDLPTGTGLDTPDLRITTPLVPLPDSVTVTAAAIYQASGYQAGYRLPGSSAWSDSVSEESPSIALAPGEVSVYRMRATGGDAYSSWAQSNPPVTPASIDAVGVDGGAELTIGASGAVSAQIFLSAIGGAFVDATLAASGDLSAPISVTGPNGDSRTAWVRAVAADGNFSAPLSASITFGASDPGGDVGGGGS